MLVKNGSSQSFRQQLFPWGGSCSGSRPQPLKTRKTLPVPAGGGTHIVLFILPLSVSSGSLRRRPPRSMRPPWRTARNTALGIPNRSEPLPALTPALMAPQGGGAEPGWAGLRAAPSQPRLPVFPSVESFVSPPSYIWFSPSFRLCLLPLFLKIFRRVTPPKSWLSFPSVKSIPCSSGAVCFKVIQIFECGQYVKKEGLSRISLKNEVALSLSIRCFWCRPSASPGCGSPSTPCLHRV